MKYLGVDFGLKRVGLAVSEGELSSPYKVIEVKGLKDAIKEVEKIVAAEGFDKVIVGLPEGKTAQKVQGFINGLRKKGLEVESSDETLSTQQAIKRMIELNIPRNKRRINDAYSASIILQGYMDEKI